MAVQPNQNSFKAPTLSAPPSAQSDDKQSFEKFFSSMGNSLFATAFPQLARFSAAIDANKRQDEDRASDQVTDDSRLNSQSPDDPSSASAHAVTMLRCCDRAEG